MPVRGDLVIGNPGPSWAALPIGPAGSLLVSDGIDPTWSNAIRNSMAAAYLNAVQTGVVDATWTKILLETELYDIGGNFDTANKRYVAPVTGYYQVNFQAYIQNVGSVALTIASSIYVDGAMILQGTQVRSDVTGHLSLTVVAGSGLVYAVAGQYIELYGYMNTSDSSTSQFSGGSNNTNKMDIVLVST
jgi:hypothetical protein